MRNPIALASGAGLLVSATGLRPPTRFSLEAPPYLYGQCTYILWLVHIREGKLALAARACDELRVHALAHAHRDKAYIRCFALAARGTIDLDDYPAVKRWYDEIAARPAVQRGVAVLAEGRDQSQITEAEREVMFGKTQFAAR